MNTFAVGFTPATVRLTLPGLTMASIQDSVSLVKIRKDLTINIMQTIYIAMYMQYGPKTIDLPQAH